METQPHARKIGLTAKTGLIILALGMALPMGIHRAAELGFSFKLILFLGLYGLAILCFIASCQIKNGYFRWAWASLFAAATLGIAGFEDASGTSVSYFHFLTLLNDRGAFRDAIFMYPVEIGWSVLTAAIVLLAIGIKPGGRSHQLNRISQIAPVGYTILLTLVLIGRDGGGITGLHPGWAGIGYSAYHGTEILFRDEKAERTVKLSRISDVPKRDIILIVDESVAGQYLDINDPLGVYSGLDEHRPDVSVHNFGLATSATNCSHGSNMALRYGGTRDQFQDYRHTQPSIWRYAKQAGLKTFHLYAYSGYEPYLSNSDLQAIDEFVSFDQVSLIERDQAAARKIVELLNNDTPEFVLLNKMGAHFPVNRSFPEDRARHRPVLSRNRLWDLKGDDTILFPGIIKQPDDWIAYRNSYRNVLEWNVGNFFDTILTYGHLRNATIIYTSDHGQNLHEKPNPARGTHCAGYPIVEEAIVPLVLIEGSDNPTENWQAVTQKNSGQISHFRVFPTLLKLMGYERNAVLVSYGNGLSSTTPDNQAFAINLYLDSDRKPTWVKVNMEKIARPLASDTASQK